MKILPNAGGGGKQSTPAQQDRTRTRVGPPFSNGVSGASAAVGSGEGVWAGGPSGGRRGEEAGEWTRGVAGQTVMTGGRRRKSSGWGGDGAGGEVAARLLEGTVGGGASNGGEILQDGQLRTLLTKLKFDLPCTVMQPRTHSGIMVYYYYYGGRFRVPIFE